MKKFILLLLGFATLFVEPFKNKINLARAEDSTSIPTTTTSSQSREIDPYLFDRDSYSNLDSLPLWTPDKFSDSHDEPEGSIEQLNSVANYSYFLVNDEAMDILSSFTEEDVEYTLNNDGNLVFLKLLNKSNEIKYCSFFYQHITPIIYFDSSLSGKQNISIYLDIGWIREDFDNLKNHFPHLNGTLPLLIINDEYSFLKVEFNETGWKLMTDHYARIEPCKRDNSSFHQDPNLMMKITIPYLDSITDIKYFNSASYTSINDAKNYSPKSTTIFCFDESLRNQYFFYFFDIVSLSMLRTEMIIDNADYYFSGKTPNNLEVDPYQKMFQVVSMKALFTGTKKEKNNAIKSSKKELKADIAPYTYTPILPKEIEFKFSEDAGYTDGEGNQYLYFNDYFDLEDNVSGEFKILSISFHPYYYNPSTNQFEMRSEIFTHHYEKANIHKYSFNVDKGIRTYYYKMVSYFRAVSKNADWYDFMFSWLFADRFYNYICFGFDFYFDKAKRFPIPNVKELTFKYQCGYKEPNPEPGSNGFYPNCGDPHKDIRVRTLQVTEKSTQGVIAFSKAVIDNDSKIVLTNNAPEKMMTDNNKVKHDYLLYALRRRGDDPGITTMDALEIRYETAPGEMVRMVGNSKGLHVVVDDDGIARVYNSEGNLEEDYGVYEANDGTLVPGQDLNGDGKIDSDEVINSDTGEKTYAPFEDDSSWLQNIVDSIGDFFNEKKTRIITTLVVIALVIVAIIFVPKLFGKRKKS